MNRTTAYQLDTAARTIQAKRARRARTIARDRARIAKSARQFLAIAFA